VRALSAASQSKAECTERALKGDRAGEFNSDTEGLWGTFRLGKFAAPVGGADIGAAEGLKGLGGTIGAVAGGELFSLCSLARGDE